MPQYGEYVDGGPNDGDVHVDPWAWHGLISALLLRNMPLYQWDAVVGVWRFLGWAFRPKSSQKPIRCSEHYKPGTLGSQMEFHSDIDYRPDRHDGWQED